jgi:phosphoenolpyruvate synthase/pyruvate phosphate dikinase
MIIDLTQKQPVKLEDVGGKAYNLHILHKLGAPVPRALVVPARISLDSSKPEILDELRLHIDNHASLGPQNRFAVRSSGVGEDGEGNSYAGIFESYLDVPKHEVFDAVQKVWQSVYTARSKMYSGQRSAAIDSMGVVIQEMIDADFAGVAFSVCPIERDERIALVEVVVGLGESLVSGQKTPATMRINKLTGMVRVQRHGADNLSADTLEEIAEVIMPWVEQIEAEYGQPMDIEWAVAAGKPYILQARPITT